MRCGSAAYCRLVLTLQGDRILLRDFLPHDREAFLALESDEAMFTYMKFRIDRGSAESVELPRLLGEPHLDPRSSYNLVVEDADGFSGWAGIDRIKGTDSGQLGWYLRSDRWGRGYATQATGLLLDFGFSVLQKATMWATADPENLASLRVLEKSGLTRRGLTDPVLTWRGLRALGSCSPSRPNSGAPLGQRPEPGLIVGIEELDDLVHRSPRTEQTRERRRSTAGPGRPVGGEEDQAHVASPVRLVQAAARPRARHSVSERRSPEGPPDVIVPETSKAQSCPVRSRATKASSMPSLGTRTSLRMSLNPLESRSTPASSRATTPRRVARVNGSGPPPPATPASSGPGAPGAGRWTRTSPEVVLAACSSTMRCRARVA